jgi:hypothetical protein
MQSVVDAVGRGGTSETARGIIIKCMRKQGREESGEERREKRGLACCVSDFWGRDTHIITRPLFFSFPPVMMVNVCVLRWAVLSPPTAMCPTSSHTLSAPSLPPSCTNAHFLTPYVFLSFLGSRSRTQYTFYCLVQRRSHESAKKAALRIRFVIVGGGPAGLACAVALRRVGHHVIVLEKGPDFIGVRTTLVPFKLAPQSFHMLTP